MTQVRFSLKLTDLQGMREFSKFFSDHSNGIICLDSERVQHV